MGNEAGDVDADYREDEQGDEPDRDFGLSGHAGPDGVLMLVGELGEGHVNFLFEG
jgi:hypothetical protein